MFSGKMALSIGRSFLNASACSMAGAIVPVFPARTAGRQDVFVANIVEVKLYDAVVNCHGVQFNQTARACLLFSAQGRPSAFEQETTQGVRCRYRGTHLRRNETEACTDCPVGTFAKTAAVRTGPQDCAKCAAGKYSNVSGATDLDVCTDCGKGKFVLMENNQWQNAFESSCIPCAAGKYSTKEGHVGNVDAACELCVAGKYSEIVGSDAESNCLDCPSGTYARESALAHRDNCTKCLAGKYNPNNGSTDPNDCDDSPRASTRASLGAARSAGPVSARHVFCYQRSHPRQ